MKQIKLEVNYKSTLEQYQELDKKITKAVGRWEDGSGTGVADWSYLGRTLDWAFKNEEEAEWAKERVQALFPNDPDITVRVSKFEIPVKYRIVLVLQRIEEDEEISTYVTESLAGHREVFHDLNEAVEVFEAFTAVDTHMRSRT